MKIRNFVGGALMAGVCIVAAEAYADGYYTTPRGGGGYNVYSSGGGDRYQGYSTPNSSGGSTFHSFRGTAGKSVLFKDATFAGKFPEAAWIDAVENRDVTAMTQSAWNLKMVETITGKRDEKITSDAMFDAAAQVAVAQGNAEALKDIVTLAPACKKYEEDMKAAGKTRGSGGSIIAMPQVVYPDFLERDVPVQKKQWDLLLRGLKPWQKPYLTTDLVHFNFRGLPTTEAESIAWLCNRGRQTSDPKLLAQAAVSMAKHQADGEMKILGAAALLEEAGELAVFLKDKEALSMIIDIYGNDALGLKSAEKVALYRDELKALGTSRGMPGAPTMRSLIVPPYIIEINRPMPLEAGATMK